MRSGLIPVSAGYPLAYFHVKCKCVITVLHRDKFCCSADFPGKHFPSRPIPTPSYFFSVHIPISPDASGCLPSCFMGWSFRPHETFRQGNGESHPFSWEVEDILGVNSDVFSDVYHEPHTRHDILRCLYPPKTSCTEFWVSSHVVRSWGTHLRWR